MCLTCGSNKGKLITVWGFDFFSSSFFFFFELSFESSLNLESEERIADRGTARVKACGGRKVHIAFLLFSC